MTPLEYGTVEVKVLRDRYKNPCIVYPKRGELGNETQTFCALLPDGSMRHETLSARMVKERFCKPSGAGVARALTRAEAEYFLTKYCRHYRMERSAFNIVEKFGRRKMADSGSRAMTDVRRRGRSGKRTERG